ncbi:MAG: SAM-dependent methyltransferase, partial [Alphaproteobacteria bacterium]|nr:SAM-dependent methyltransferase [Alphaproteobacteria bacterium]
MDDKAPELEPRFFARRDESDDAAFYGPPRLVQHLDEAAR